MFRKVYNEYFEFRQIDAYTITIEDSKDNLNYEIEYIIHLIFSQEILDKLYKQYIDTYSWNDILLNLMNDTAYLKSLNSNVYLIEVIDYINIDDTELDVLRITLKFKTERELKSYIMKLQLGNGEI